MTEAQLIERRTGECGCPEEHYMFNGIDLIVHFEPTGEADAHLDGGDWGEAEMTVEAPARPDAARATIFAWAAALTDGPQP